MKAVSCATGVVLIGNETAHLLADYARILEQRGEIDGIVVAAIGPGGTPVEAVIVLGARRFSTTPVQAQAPEPDNSAAHEIIRVRMSESLTGTRSSTRDCTDGPGDWD
jgi:hypothetical protein